MSTTLQLSEELQWAGEQVEEAIDATGILLARYRLEITKEPILAAAMITAIIHAKLTQELTLSLDRIAAALMKA